MSQNKSLIAALVASILKENKAAYKYSSKYFLGTLRKEGAYNQLFRLDTLEDVV